MNILGNTISDDKYGDISIKPENNLISEINRKWQRAKRGKQKIEQVMLNSMRNIDGEYSPEKLSALRSAGSPEIFRMLTAQKMRELKIKILEIYLFSGKDTWTLSPTPIPELPSDITNKIREKAREITVNAAKVYQQQHQTNVNYDDYQQVLKDYETELNELVEQKINEVAATSALKMKTKIKDQLVDANWNTIFKDVVDDFVKYPNCFVECPRIVKKKTASWVVTEEGRYDISFEDKLCINIRRISPLDVYPEPDSTGINNGYLFIREKITPEELSDFIGAPGWNDDAIRNVLKTWPRGGNGENTIIDNERNKLENKNDLSVFDSEKLEVLRYLGNISGELLSQQGIDVPDVSKQYAVDIWTISGEVVKSILSTDRLGIKPIHTTSWEPQAGSFWGKGAAELISDIQEECNTYKRTIVYNTNMASGPQVEMNIDRLDPSEDGEITPWGRYLVTSKQMMEAPAIRFTDVPLVVEQISRLYDKAKNEADEILGIVSFPGARLGRAAETASGMSMVMTDAAKGTKYSAASIDDLVSGVIASIYHHNMLYDDDESIKGDMVPEINGVGSVVTKEQLSIRRSEFLNQVLSNPLAVNIIGLETTKKVLSEQARTLDMPNIADMIEKYQIPNQVQANMSGQTSNSIGNGKSPQTLDVAGNPDGGTDTNLFKGNTS